MSDWREHFEAAARERMQITADLLAREQLLDRAEVATAEALREATVGNIGVAITRLAEMQQQQERIIQLQTRSLHQLYEQIAQLEHCLQALADRLEDR